MHQQGRRPSCKTNWAQYWSTPMRTWVTRFGVVANVLIDGTVYVHWADGMSECRNPADLVQGERAA